MTTLVEPIKQMAETKMAGGLITKVKQDYYFQVIKVIMKEIMIFIFKIVVITRVFMMVFLVMMIFMGSRVLWW